jgi:uncharacterized protein YjbI with pentapeptide repeats
MIKNILRAFKEWIEKYYKYLKLPLLALGIIWVLLVAWQVPLYILTELPAGSKDLVDAQDELRKTFIQIIVGIAIFYGLYLTARRTKAIEETALKITTEGQITERFTKAVEQLGNDRLEIRLGGIYALERIARDSKTDHWAVMEVLTTFVRENSSVEKKAEKEPYIDEQNSDEEKNNIAEKTVTPDTQAILAVIRRRKWIDSEPKRINLNNSYLSSFLSRADLRGADLRGADFRKARLGGADLQGANLRGADLREADLQGTDIRGADLQGVYFQGANLGGANLRGAYLRGAYLERTYLRETNLGGANQQGAYLREANLGGANLRGADLRGADLERADLGEANLGGADLRRANFREADLGGANLRGTENLTLEQLSAAKTLYKAELDASLLKKVKSEYPHLLQKSKES